MNNIIVFKLVPHPHQFNSARYFSSPNIDELKIYYNGDRWNDCNYDLYNGNGIGFVYQNKTYIYTTLMGFDYAIANDHAIAIAIVNRDLAKKYFDHQYEYSSESVDNRYRKIFEKNILSLFKARGITFTGKFTYYEKTNLL